VPRRRPTITHHEPGRSPALVGLSSHSGADAEKPDVAPAIF
jgi:hypothetical protein